MSVMRRRMMMAPPRMGYVQEGLVLHLDGIYNTPTGHDPNAQTWYDLSGHNVAVDVDALAVWESDGLYIASGGAATRDLKPFSAKPLTIEFALFKKSVVRDGYIVTTDSDSAIYMVLNPNRSGDTRGVAYYRAAAPVYSSGDAEETGMIYVSGVTSDANQIALYKSGDLARQMTRSDMYISDGNLVIGASETAGRDTFADAAIKSVRVYDRDLTADEVARNYAIDKRRFGL